MSFDRAQLHPGMQVVGANGDQVGSIKEIRASDFLVNRRMHRDVYVPFDAVTSVSQNVVTLNVVSDQVGNMGWPEPPLPGSREH